MTTYIWPEGGGSGLDRFAPKYVVGNVLAGDPNTPQLGAFRYIPDPGDGSGIALALTQPDGPGDVWIRPGTYDFGTGAVAMPLTIPAGTRVQGAGNTTILRARVAGDQGVFVLAGPGGSQLRDMRIEGPAAGGTGSTALVLVLGSGCILSGLSIAYQATDVGALRYGIDVNTAGQNPIPFSSLENVSITVDLLPPLPVVPVSLLHIVEGEVSARNLMTLGGNIGIELANQENSSACVFFGSDILCAGWEDYGLHYYEAAAPAQVGPGASRISTGIFVGSGVGAGMRVEGGFLHVLRSGYIANTGFGVLVAPPATRSSSIQIDDCLIQGYQNFGVQFDGSAGTVNSSSVSDTEIAAGQFPIYIVGPNTSGINVASNTLTAIGKDCRGIAVFDAVDTNISGNDITVAAVNNNSYGINVEAAPSTTIADNNIDADAYMGIRVDATSTRTAITGNDVAMVGSAVATFAAVYVEGTRCTITGNTVLSGDAGSTPVGPGIGSIGVRCTVTGNTIDMPAAAGQSAVLIGGNQSACTGNVAGVDTSPVAAIAVFANDCTVIANVCGTVPTVNNAGVGNEVAHNT